MRNTTGLAYLRPFRSAETNKAKKGQAQSLGQAKPEAGCSPTSPCSRAEGGLWIPLPGVVLAFCPGQEPGPGSAFPQPQGKLLQSEHDPRPQWVPLPPTPALGVWHQGQGPTNHSVLSFTSLLKGPWGVHLGRRPKWPWTSSSWRGRPALSCLRLLEPKPQAGEVLAS